MCIVNHDRCIEIKSKKRKYRKAILVVVPAAWIHHIYLKDQRATTDYGIDDLVRGNAIGSYYLHMCACARENVCLFKGV
jgi:hypothetical protein